jgi:lipoate-protein ligase A
MGISGQPDTLLNTELVKRDNIPVIRRFSGGGTVIVDEETLFVTFIFSKGVLDVAPFPESIMRWSADLYASAWRIPGFFLRENDYVIGDKKCGGNAQYIKKDRWLHHTSFLWNYKAENMEYLQLPAKRPKYRQDRGHQEFLCCLKNYEFDSFHDLSSALLSELVKQFYIEFFDVSLLKRIIHRVSTCRI